MDVHVIWVLPISLVCMALILIEVPYYHIEKYTRSIFRKPLTEYILLLS